MLEFHVTWVAGELSDEFNVIVVSEDEAFNIGWDALDEIAEGGQVTVEFVGLAHA